MSEVNSIEWLKKAKEKGATHVHIDDNNFLYRVNDTDVCARYMDGDDKWSFVRSLSADRDHMAEIDYSPLEKHEAKTELQYSPEEVAFNSDDHDALTFHTIEKDPNGIDQHSAGAKLDHGKCLAGVLLDFGRALERVADVGTFGANKYTRGGWQSVQNGKQRYEDALMRHLLAAKRGDGTDDQTGMSHLHHAAWNILAIIELKERANESSSD